MNQRNVEALTDVLIALKWDDYGLIEARDMARRLARKGVLVPSALTDEDAAECAFLELDRGLRAPNLAKQLERIAKGETE